MSKEYKKTIKCRICDLTCRPIGYSILFGRFIYVDHILNPFPPDTSSLVVQLTSKLTLKLGHKTMRIITLDLATLWESVSFRDPEVFVWTTVMKRFIEAFAASLVQSPLILQRVFWRWSAQITLA